MKAPLSILIGTYNRCNENEGFPLVWTFDSIKQQSYIPPVWIADDCSDEQHSQRIKNKCQEYGFNYIRSNKRLGCSGIRKFALDFIQSPWYLILDDDLILYGNKTLEKMVNLIEESNKDKIGAIIYPAYDRVPFPTSFVPLDKIGKIDTSKGIVYWFLNSFPKEYISNPKGAPLIKVSAGGSYGTYNTESTKKSGGFRRGGRNDFAMESELIWRMKKGGYDILYSPDPEKGSLHLRFGIKSEVTPQEIIKSLNQSLLNVTNKIWGLSPEEMLNKVIGNRKLSELIEISNNYFINGGCRIEEEKWIEDRISNELGQIIAYYPVLDKFVGGASYIKRTIEHVKDFRISRRKNSLNMPCNIDNDLTQVKKIISILRGLIKGVYMGVKWSMKKY